MTSPVRPCAGPPAPPARTRTPGLFFPIVWDDQAGQRAEQARSICRACPVQAICLDWALRTGEPDGMWGGTTPEERRRIRTRQAQATA
ncbi:hypothetical protein GCM10020220_029780 [Nonomuraea rubra]|uniref:WhiB family transcriptional regulator n=1 Tax=Nonomuraea rubra TaxID=46180 RepID=UPI0031ED30C2